MKNNHNNCSKCFRALLNEHFDAEWSAMQKGYELGCDAGREYGREERELELVPLIFRVHALIHGALAFANRRDVSSECVRQHAIEAYCTVLALLDSAIERTE